MSPWIIPSRPYSNLKPSKVEWLLCIWVVTQGQSLIVIHTSIYIHAHISAPAVLVYWKIVNRSLNNTDYNWSARVSGYKTYFLYQFWLLMYSSRFRSCKLSELSKGVQLRSNPKARTYQNFHVYTTTESLRSTGDYWTWITHFHCWYSNNEGKVPLASQHFNHRSYTAIYSLIPLTTSCMNTGSFLFPSYPSQQPPQLPYY